MTSSFMVATASNSQIERFTLKRGQVAITKDSETRYDIGIPTYIADDFEEVILGYHCALITPNPQLVDGRYLSAYLATKQSKEYFANNASGSGQRFALSIDAIRNIIVYLPPIRLQKKISDILSTIDRKIELNKQINRNLSLAV